MPRKAFFLLPLVALLVAACAPLRRQEAAAIPLLPVEYVAQRDGVSWLRAPLRVHDTQLPLVVYDGNGNVSIRTVDDTLFPTDVLIVYSTQNDEVRVFLRRSPHGGCLLLYYEGQDARFEDPCYGSRFDLAGKYISGPSPRHLDQLPATIQGDMIWVTP
jgi:Rieske Fe-S protein